MSQTNTNTSTSPKKPQTKANFKFAIPKSKVNLIPSSKLSFQPKMPLYGHKSTQRPTQHTTMPRYTIPSRSMAYHTPIKMPTTFVPKKKMSPISPIGDVPKFKKHPWGIEIGGWVFSSFNRAMAGQSELKDKCENKSSLVFFSFFLL